MYLKPEQNCSQCMNLYKCWPATTNSGKTVSTQNILINILVCRLQKGININATTSNLLKILRPGIISLITHARQSGSLHGMDMEQIIADIQSTAIEYLIRDYKIGDRGRATPYLFNPQNGFLTKHIKWLANKSTKFYANHELHGDFGSDQQENNDYDMAHNPSDNMTSWDTTSVSDIFSPYVQEDETNPELLGEISSIIEDGMTLTCNEYRVIRFCSANCNESTNIRHIDGLHIRMSKIMGVSRPRITRLYKRAKEKITAKYMEIKNAKL